MNNFAASVTCSIKNEAKLDLNVIFCDIILCSYIYFENYHIKKIY